VARREAPARSFDRELQDLRFSARHPPHTPDAECVAARRPHA
jgi:hypothetical protein